MNKQKIINMVAPAFAIVALALSGYFYYQWNTLKKNPQAIAQKEVKDLVARVASVTVLPEGETPTIATVTDLAALKDQPFFASAQKGDKVLIYAQAKKAILYSPTLNKVLNIAPLNIGNGTAKSTTATTTTKATTAPTTEKKP
jgi:hypothetical protein